MAGKRVDRNRVRVVIVHYGPAEVTLRCVQALLRQDYFPLNIVVVDNASKDPERRRLLDQLPPQVALITSPRNVGYAAGNNIGVTASPNLPEPEFVLFVNNDVFCRDETIIRRLAMALRRDSMRVACSPLVATQETLDPHNAIQVRRLPGYVDCLVALSPWLGRLPGLRRIHLRHVYGDQRPFRLCSEVRCDSINGACFLIRRDFLDEIGLLDEGTFLYFEEMILARQIAERGRDCCLVTGVVVEHLQGTSSGYSGSRVPINMYFHSVRSQVYYCRRYLQVPGVALAILILVRAIDFCIMWPYRVAKRAFASFLPWG